MVRSIELEQEACDACGTEVVAQTLTQTSAPEEETRRLCLRCFNDLCAAYMGIDGFEHVDFEPVSIIDFAGDPHVFLLQLRLYPDGIGLYADEIGVSSGGGYSFAASAGFDADPHELHEQLIDRIQRHLAVQHLDIESGRLNIRDSVVRGTISSASGDEGFGREPVLIIDGRPVSLDELSEMLEPLEGWQFRLEILDKFEES